ncbi:MAG: TIGR00299 family protein [Planctomycetes bacterium RBG_16_64_10]|nr:MAG: TIGR00299 family protein [Planctomycetes bacterium RBG_16_64_10]
MRAAYLDCQSGISGDMMLGALIDAGIDLAIIQAGIDSLGLPGCHLRRSEVKRHGFRATQVVVEHPPEHVHRRLPDVVALIERSALSARQQGLATDIFARLAQAEANVHGTTTEAVQFHEVGAVDSIADIVGTAIGWDLLRVDRAWAAPVPTGHGVVEIAHGRCSIPAPATAELLRGIPLAESPVTGELTTPTGAAILAALANHFGPLPAMTIEQIGYGAGQRQYENHANVLRLLVGPLTDGRTAEQVWIVETNLDDISGELIGYCTERLWQVGALDVATTAIQMKKNRPGVQLSVLCRAADVDRVEAVLFRETTTLGVRRWRVERTRLDRAPHEVSTPWGKVAGMRSSAANGRPCFAPEFESCRRLATAHNLPLKVVFEAAVRAFDPSAP